MEVTGVIVTGVMVIGVMVTPGVLSADVDATVSMSVSAIDVAAETVTGRLGPVSVMDASEDSTAAVVVGGVITPRVLVLDSIVRSAVPSGTTAS